MLRWLFGICGRLFRQTDHESGVHAPTLRDIDAMLADAVAKVDSESDFKLADAVEAPRRALRSQFMLAERIASSKSLNVPSERAPAKQRRVSSTKPTPKIVETQPKAMPKRRSVVLVGGGKATTRSSETEVAWRQAA